MATHACASSVLLPWKQGGSFGFQVVVVKIFCGAAEKLLAPTGGGKGGGGVLGLLSRDC